MLGVSAFERGARIENNEPKKHNNSIFLVLFESPATCLLCPLNHRAGSAIPSEVTGLLSFDKG
jgi:hypothetical protein